MISEVLKESTKPLHDLVEAKFNSHKIFDGTFTLQDYRNLLYTNYLFLLQLEQPVFSSITEENNRELHSEKRNKLPLIEKDLEVLNLEKMLAPGSVDVKNEAEAFGILYVMEGSTLGGNMIAKKLADLPEFQETSFHYFRCYGQNTGSFWKNFKAVMDDKITPDDYEDCISGAHKAYSSLLDSAK